MTFFGEKISIFTAKISDDLFFLVIDPVFRISPFFRVFTMLNVVYDPYLTTKTAISENNSLYDTFFTLFVLFARLRQHCFSKYWGGPMHGTSPPPQTLGETVPPSPPRSPPLLVCSRTLNFFLINIDTLILSTGSHYVDSFS